MLGARRCIRRTASYAHVVGRQRQTTRHSAVQPCAPAAIMMQQRPFLHPVNSLRQRPHDYKIHPGAILTPPAATAMELPLMHHHCGPRRWYFSTTKNNKDAASLVEEEEQYSRIEQRQHILMRPNMYVGATTTRTVEKCWVPDSVPPLPSQALRTESLSELPVPDDNDPPQSWPTRIVQRDCTISPALVKVFDEILVNASDNRLRHPRTCNRIDVVIDPGAVAPTSLGKKKGKKTKKKSSDNNNQYDREPLIRVFNNGKGIPVKIHKKEGMYIPEMLFGHLLTGSNFDDSVKRVVGGLHGYGAKLSNIFSKSFTVQVADATTQKLYTQTWTNNMADMGPAEITPYKTGKDYLCISFVPDVERMRGKTKTKKKGVVIQDDEYALMCRRVLDVAGAADGKLTVTLNGLDVSVPSFASYLSLYPDTEHMVFCNVNARWKVGVGYSSRGYQSVSFVNGVSTDLGGPHVDVITKQIQTCLLEAVEKKEKGLLAELSDYVKKDMVKNQLFVAVDALIENPKFDSQTKEKLSTEPKDFGSSYQLPKTFLRQIAATRDKGGPGLVEELVSVAQSKHADNRQKALNSNKAKKSKKKMRG